MISKNLTHIKVKAEDRDIWKEYCRALGEPSHKLFNKILTSKELNLTSRVITEHRKKEEQLRRRLK